MKSYNYRKVNCTNKGKVSRKMRLAILYDFKRVLAQVTTKEETNRYIMRKDRKK